MNEFDLTAAIERLSVIDNPQSFHAEARLQIVCAQCRKRTHQWEAHHVVAKQRCKIERAPLHSPDNAMRLCAKHPGACHERHTCAQERVSLARLRDEHLAFAVRWLGGGAYYYLVGQYDCSEFDPRLNALLEFIDG